LVGFRAQSISGPEVFHFRKYREAFPKRENSPLCGCYPEEIRMGDRIRYLDVGTSLPHRPVWHPYRYGIFSCLCGNKGTYDQRAKYAGPVRNTVLSTDPPLHSLSRIHVVRIGGRILRRMQYLWFSGKKELDKATENPELY